MELGDMVPVSAIGGAGGVAELAKVTTVEALQLSHKNFLVTKKGTVLANGMLVTTVCEGKDAIMYRESMDAALAHWRDVHFEAPTTQSCAVLKDDTKGGMPEEVVV